MARLKSYTLAGATFCAALTIGFVMQHGIAPAPRAQTAITAPVEISAITDTSSAASRLPEPALATATALPEAHVEKVAAKPAPMPARPAPTPAASDCAISMDAQPAAGAMVELTLSAPCYGNERLTIHHHGLMFTEVTDAEGKLRIDVPALSESALFIVAFDNGDGMTAMTQVTSLPFYDRVVVQWKGSAGVELHALEQGNGAPEHVWSAAAGDLARSIDGTGGFLTRLGDADTPEALLAEVYSFPRGTAKTPEDVELWIEAEVTKANCGTELNAQTLELRDESGLRARDLTLQMPSCEAAGQFLVLKNVIEDLKIAAN